jgi:uncharacterized protein (DUF1015 family)
MAHVYPTILTHPLRNKACIFPTEDDCELTSVEINAIIKRNPYSFNNILYKPYIKRLQGLKKYKAIKRQYLKFKKNNIIRTGENPGFYIYSITDNEKNQFTGIVGKMPHTDFQEQLVHKIEKSSPALVAEKIDLINHTGFIAKPITVVHENLEGINQIIDKYRSKIPLYEFTRNNGFVHEVWEIINPEDIAFIKEAFNQGQTFNIIDDNNYFEALHQIYQDKINQSDDFVSGQEAFNYFPAFLISQNQVKLHEYKKGIPVEYPKDIEEVLKVLKKDFDIEKIDHVEPPEEKEILLYALSGKYKLTPKKHIHSSLPDSVIFEHYILPKLSDPQTDIQIESLKFCDGKRSPKCVENQLNKGNCKFGFIVKPMDFEQIQQTIDQNIAIPFKSLYLEPRPLKGLFIYEI